MLVCKCSRFTECDETTFVNTQERNKPKSVTRLTLAIPNFNGARYLAHTLKSFRQNRPYVRWWLQDACSSDDSVEIASRYAGPEDRIAAERDRGQTDALNRAFARMGGDIIGYVNSDDLLADGAAETVLETFDKHPDVDLVYGEVEWIDMNGNVTGYHRGDISTLEEVLDIYNVWWAGRQWVQPEVFFRRSLWERVGEFSHDYDLGFDYHYWVRCFLAGVRVKRIPRVLARFRKHAEQKSARAFEAACEVRNAALEGLQRASGLNWWTALRIGASLGYDRYHAGQDHQGRSFPSALVANPQWLLAPSVRRRLCQSLVR
jgi:glycosyltransferase involved in cell wall biosynthesis